MPGETKTISRGNSSHHQQNMVEDQSKNKLTLSNDHHLDTSTALGTIQQNNIGNPNLMNTLQGASSIQEGNITISASQGNFDNSKIHQHTIDYKQSPDMVGKQSPRSPLQDHEIIKEDE